MSAATPHRASMRSTRGSSFFAEDDYLYDSIPTRQSASSFSRHGTQPTSPASFDPAGRADWSRSGSALPFAGVGLEVTGEIPHVVKAAVGLVDQVCLWASACLLRACGICTAVCLHATARGLSSHLCVCVFA